MFDIQFGSDSSLLVLGVYSLWTYHFPFNLAPPVAFKLKS